MNNEKITAERNAQIVIALMKAHGIKKVVTSPGTMNVCLISSIQDDPFFEIYSAPEERSAGYIACGMAAESGETIVLTCTGATASRNYMPALTEAFYRQLPVLVITCSKRSIYIGHTIEQVTDRTLLPRDVAKISVQAGVITDKETEWACEVACNRAFLELRHKGSGPVHINLETQSNREFISEAKPVRVIKRYENNSKLPEIKAKNIAIIVGNHNRWDEALTEAVDEFCEKYNGAVLCDQTSNYKGKYGVYHNLIMVQHHYTPFLSNVDFAVHIGNVSSSNFNINAKEVWRVNKDGEIRDICKKLTGVFEMSELEFFKYYATISEDKNVTDYYRRCMDELNDAYSRIPELPFSSFYIAKKYAGKLPSGSSVHYGIRNSLRAFSYFEAPVDVYCYSNTGGFGIDGCMSSAIGASFCIKELCFCILGDLAFFYDLNSLGNRHIGKNLRIILVNNGTGMEMNFTDSFPGSIGAERDKYIAASGHYGNKSREVVKHYSQDMGFKYLSAENKEQLDDCIAQMFDKDSEQSIVCEIFIEKNDEDVAYSLISRLMVSKESEMKEKIKDGVSGLIGKKGRQLIKTLLSD